MTHAAIPRRCAGILLALVLPLAGCGSSRDAELSEKVAAAQAAADRAVRAADAAERAAAAVNAHQAAPTFAADEPAESAESPPDDEPPADSGGDS